jgi:hypothetical protein
MMDLLFILAKAAENTTQSGSLVPIDEIWKHITSLGKLEALTFISFGSVCLFYGWRVFTILVTIALAMFGLLLGEVISQQIGGGENPLLSVMLCIVMAAISFPLMRWAVSFLAAAAGAIIAAGVWYAFNLPENYIWAGALVGGVAGGMISFIVYKIAVMLFSSFGGSGLILAGVLALMHLYPPTKDQIQNLVFNEQWFLPMALIIPTVLGVYFQNKFIKSSPDWSI